MTNATTPQQHIDISPTEQVSSTSVGKVQSTNWKASDGYARQAKIQKERQAAYVQQQPVDPNEVRLQMMEGAIADLQKKFEELKNG